MKDDEFVIMNKFRLKKKTYFCICIDLKNDESYCVFDNAHSVPNFI